MENAHTDSTPADGAETPAPTFADFDLDPGIAKVIAEMGFETPTPVQARIHLDAMAGKNLIVMAQTGTGKTAAFGLPLAHKIDPGKGAVQALVLAPTRELALQVSREVGRIGGGRGLRCAAIYGGASFSTQVDEVGAGAQIVVGTPGRVLDHLRRGTIDFSQVRHLVLDEADEMLSMGFEKELSAIIEGLPPRRQTLLFSATIPDDIQRLAGRYMSDAEIVSVSGDAVAAAEISHYVYLVSGSGRLRDLARVLEVERPGSAIVFCNTKDETQAVARYLREAGYDADWINSDLSQAERERVMAATRRGELKFLVATDVAARGIDISHLSHVINYSFPESLEVYVHRTGRTGRQGRHGAAVSLITPQDIGNLYFLRLTYKIFPVERQLPSRASEARDRELHLLEELRRGMAALDGEQHRGLARRVLQSIDVEQILVGLLGRWFGTADEEEESAGTAGPEAGRSRRPRRRRGRRPPGADERDNDGEQISAEPEARPEPEPEPEARPEPEPAKAREPEPEARPEPEPAKASEPEPEKDGDPLEFASRVPPAGDDDGRLREIYLDAGRKDGLRISTLMKEIVELSGLPRTAIGRVRMLTRATFVAVPEESFEAVLRVLGEMQVDGRHLTAEPAEDR